MTPNFPRREIEAEKQKTTTPHKESNNKNLQNQSSTDGSSSRLLDLDTNIVEERSSTEPPGSSLEQKQQLYPLQHVEANVIR